MQSDDVTAFVKRTVVAMMLQTSNPKEYDAVGQAEVEAGIAVAKEVLKAVYQYTALLKQLRALKKPLRDPN